ncbi:MAG: hypothetical protein KJ061_17325 [Vicinamibacteraceae bacterium]|nr:hypothetical protein [Vicinamibacteraceae bacterium]
MTLDDPVPYRDGCRLLLAGVAEVIDALVDRQTPGADDGRGPIEVLVRPARRQIVVVRRRPDRTTRELVRIAADPDQIEHFGAAVRRERP